MAMKETGATILTVCCLLIGVWCTYTRLFSKEKRKNLEAKTWFKLIIPFALTWGIIHVIAAAGSIFAAMVLAAAYAVIETFFARDKITQWVKSIFKRRKKCSESTSSTRS